MTQSFKKVVRKIFTWSLVVFIAMFLFRMLYGYGKTETGGTHYYGEDFFSSLAHVRKNYASENIKMKADVQQQSSIASNQKFEKTASIKSKSSEFEKDEKAIKRITKAYSAIIQYEQNIGQKDSRQIHLLIGVNPLLFDSFCKEMQKIGALRGIEVTKVDKTNEYKQLNAQKASLEKTLQSLTELKARVGQISDFVSLHDKILEIEERLQKLGIDLGDFDSENEFCTVKLSLYEGAAEKNITLIQRTKVSLEWTIKYFSVMVLTVFGLLAASFFLVVILDKFKVISTLADKMKE